MWPFSFENGQVPSAHDELSAERNERRGHLLAVCIQHRLVLDRLSGNRIGLHDELLSPKVTKSRDVSAPFVR
jgi:hypothetical protein